MTGAPGLVYLLDRTCRAKYWREWESAGRVLRSEHRRHNRYAVERKFAFDLNTSVLKNTTNSREKADVTACPRGAGVAISRVARLKSSLAKRDRKSIDPIQFSCAINSFSMAIDTLGA